MNTIRYIFTLFAVTNLMQLIMGGGTFKSWPEWLLGIVGFCSIVVIICDVIRVMAADLE